MRILSLSLLVFFLSVSSICAADHAAVLLYHHVSSLSPDSTSVSPEVFRRHLDYLAENDFNVLALSQILNTLAEGRELPDKTVSITFDDAYRSVLESAIPMLRQRNWPCTVFVNTLAVDEGYRNYMTWSELREIQAAGAEIGNHSRTHSHLVRRIEGESEQKWRERIIEDIETAKSRLQEELGAAANMFAYPYGEHTPELRQIIGELGYFGIAQQSGAVGRGFDSLAVPRFPMAAEYANMDRFRLRVNARQLPVAEVSISPVVLVQGSTSQHHLEFILLPGNYSKSALSCYSSSGEKLLIKTFDFSGEERFSINLPDWKAGRKKINCTAPSAKEKGVYFWYSHLWLVMRPDGTWYEE